MPQLTGTARAWLSLLREGIASSDLLPKAYARYRPLIADALCFFLARISSGRLQKILSRQMQLPASTSTAQRIVSILEELPALHKLGQVLARDRRLNARFRRRLQHTRIYAASSPRGPGCASVSRLAPGTQPAAVSEIPADLDGVVADVSRTKQEIANALLDEVVLAGFAEQWILEWPRRFCAPFEDRSFGTHISTNDLVTQMCYAPSTFARWWAGSKR